MATKQPNWPFIINLGNSIIGVSVLAMPFCFKQCGVVLGMLLLFGSAWLTHTSCNLLIKGAFSSRKRSYEYLALHTFGPAGKLCVEISIIGLLIGTCVAFFVIIGDLGPAIISRIFAIDNTWNLRLLIMVLLAFTVALPLGLLKNVESLANISALSIGFYSVFVAEVFSTAFPNLWSGIWVTKVVYWNPEGVFRCLPIFSLAFACQTQLFVMYDALHEPSLKRMNTITRSAIGMVTMAYLCVGYFGYVAFCEEGISGDILLNFKPTIFSEAVKLGFVVSVAASFPLVIFPLRAAIYTLIFFKDHEKQHEVLGPIYIPDAHMKVITILIIIGTLVVGILLPNIEFVLALTGATMGSMICFIYPAVMYISVMSMAKNSGKSVAQLVLFLGFTILLASTYVTLNAHDRKQPAYDEGKYAQAPEIPNNDYGIVKEPAVEKFNIDPVKFEDTRDPGKKEEPKPDQDHVKGNENPVVNGKEDKREEPPNPEAPVADADDMIPDQPVKEVPNVDKKEVNPLDLLANDVQEEKDDTDVKRDVDDPAKGQNVEAKQLLEELKEQQKVQEQLIEKQMEIIEELKHHQKEAHADDGQNQLQQQLQEGDQGVVPEGGQVQQQQQLPEKQIPQQLPEKQIPPQLPEKRVPQQHPEKQIPRQLPEKQIPQQLPEEHVPQQLPEKQVPQQVPGKQIPQQLPEKQIPQHPQNQLSDKQSPDNRNQQQLPNKEIQQQLLDNQFQQQAQPDPDNQRNFQGVAQPVREPREAQAPDREYNVNADNVGEPQGQGNLHEGQYQQGQNQLGHGQQDKQEPPKQFEENWKNLEVNEAKLAGNEAAQNSANQYKQYNAGAAKPNPQYREAVVREGGASKRRYDEASLTHMLVNLIKKPIEIDLSREVSPADKMVGNLIKSLSGLKSGGDQWDSQLQKSINQLLNDPVLAESLHRVAKNAGIVDKSSANVQPIQVESNRQVDNIMQPYKADRTGNENKDTLKNKEVFDKPLKDNRAVAG